jgi:putative thioredoxin
MANSPWVIDVDEARFTTEVLERSKQTPVLVDFTASWCGPCRVLGPILEKLANELQGRFVLAKVDFDRNPSLARQFGVQGIPAVFAFVDGRPARHFVGALPEAQVRAFLEQVLPSASQISLKRARELVEGDPAEALGLVESAAKDQSGGEEAAALRARALLLLDRDAEARRFAEQVTEGSEFYREAANVLAQLDFREQARQLGGIETCRRRTAANGAQDRLELGVCLAAQGGYEEALKELLAAAEADPNLAKGPVKEVMVKIFHLLGSQSELADEYRGKLAALLY